MADFELVDLLRPDGLSLASDGSSRSEGQQSPLSPLEAPIEGQSETAKKALTGYLVKQGNKGPIKLWHTRWFIFDDRRCMLFYYRSPQDFVPLGSIDIAKASFSFDVDNLHKGQFSISVEGRVFLLQAQSKKAMLFWLSELQERRRQYSQRRLQMPITGTSAMSKQLQPRGGLTGSSAEPESPLTCFPSSGSASSGFGMFDFSLSSLRNKPFLHRPGSGAPGQKASHAAASAKAHVAQIKAKEQKQSATGASVLIEVDEMDDAGGQTDGAGGAGGKSETVPRRKGGSGWSISLESVKKRMSLKRFTGGQSTDTQPDTQPSVSPSLSRKTSQEEIQKLMGLKDDLEATERELSAKTQVIHKLQQDLREAQLEKSAAAQFIATGDDQDRLQLLVKRDQKITRLEEAKMMAEEEKDEAEQQMRESEHKLSDAEEQLAMFREMLQAKDQVVMNLTNQLFELEHKVPNDKTQASVSETGYGIVTESGRVPLIPDTVQQLQLYKDACEGYKVQNSFLNSEVLELNRLRTDDEQRMKRLFERLTFLEAELCKVRSKHLLLLQEVNVPRRGGESGPSQDMICQLLEDAMSSDVDFAGVEQQSEDADRYGFKHDFHKDENAVETMANKLLQQSQRLEETDAAHFVRWENYLMHHGKKELEYSAEVKHLIRSGIPHEHRNQMWTLCVHALTQDVKAEKGSGYYQRLVGSHSQSQTLSIFFKQIELDLLRTMPNNKYYDQPDALGVVKLRNVLKAYACHNPVVGYCQGINRLVAVALLYMDEEDAFWCLIAIVEVLMPPEYYTNTLLASQVDQRVLKDILAEKIPRLHAHFEHHQIDLSLITFNWFLTVFVDNAPVELSFRIWDSFLYEGSKVLFRFALALFKLNEEELLAIDNTMALFNCSRGVAHKSLDLKRLSHIAFNDMNPFPMKNITAKRAVHTATVKAEMQELENIRSACQRSYTFHSSQNTERGAASDEEG